MLNKMTLRTGRPLAWYSASTPVTRSSLCDGGLRACQFACLFVFDSPFFLSFFYAPDSSLLAWQGSSGEPSLQFAIVCHHLPL